MPSLSHPSRLASGGTAAPLKVAIASSINPTSVGGLAAYQRKLGDELHNSQTIKGLFLSVTDAQSTPASGTEALKWPAHAMMPTAKWQQQRHWMGRLASRAPLVRFADSFSRLINHRAAWKSTLKDVDALHFVGTGWDVIGFPLCQAARAAGVPFTIWPAVHPKSWGDDAIDVWLYRQADAVFCQSEYEKAHLASLGVPVQKLVRCGLPPMCQTNGNGERLRSKLEIRESPAVLFLGRRDVGKGYPALLDAWPLVLKQCPDAVLLLAGPGNADAPRLAQIPPENVRDLGCPSEQEKADAYAACDVFCLPSAHESFGIVYVEAWSYGKPVVCGTAPASRELVQNNVTGVWADQHPQQLAAGLLRLLKNHDHRHALGAAGLRLQLASFTAESMAGCHRQTWELASSN